MGILLVENDSIAACGITPPPKSTSVVDHMLASRHGHCPPNIFDPEVLAR